MSGGLSLGTDLWFCGPRYDRQADCGADQPIRAVAGKNGGVMSDTVDLLEQLGAGARYGANDLETLLAKSSIDDAALKALRDGDAVELRTLLGASPYVGIVMPAEEEDEDEGEGEAEESPGSSGRATSADVGA